MPPAFCWTVTPAQTNRVLLPIRWRICLSPVSYRICDADLKYLPLSEDLPQIMLSRCRCLGHFTLLRVDNSIREIAIIRSSYLEYFNTSTSQTLFRNEVHHTTTNSIAEHAWDSYYLSMIKEIPFTTENLAGSSMCLGLGLSWVKPIQTFKFVKTARLNVSRGFAIGLLLLLSLLDIRSHV